MHFLVCKADVTSRSGNSDSQGQQERMLGVSEKLESKKSGELLTPHSRKRDREGDRPRDPGGIDDSGADYHLSSKRHRRDRGRDRGRERDKDRGRRKSRSLSRGERDKRRERSSRERRRPSRRGTLCCRSTFKITFLYTQFTLRSAEAGRYK